MADKTDDERVSIWSTGDTERTWLIFLASVFFYPSLAFVVWQSIENDLYKTTPGGTAGRTAGSV